MMIHTITAYLQLYNTYDLLLVSSLHDPKRWQMSANEGKQVAPSVDE
jgi:hypothetical protein